MCEIRRRTYPCCRKGKWLRTYLSGVCEGPDIRCGPELCLFVGEVQHVDGNWCTQCREECREDGQMLRPAWVALREGRVGRDGEVRGEMDRERKVKDTMGEKRVREAEAEVQMEGVWEERGAVVREARAEAEKRLRAQRAADQEGLGKAEHERRAQMDGDVVMDVDGQHGSGGDEGTI